MKGWAKAIPAAVSVLLVGAAAEAKAPKGARPDAASMSRVFDESTPGPLPDDWRAVLERHAATMAAAPETCAAGDQVACAAVEWERRIAEIGEQHPRVRDALTLVNIEVNAIPYKSDRATWGKEDYWATPGEVYWKKAADCEDYAIAKYLALRDLGVPEDAMRIAVVRDTRTEDWHAVLAVRTDRRVLILDNGTPQVTTAEETTWYLPLRSMNAKGAWRHPDFDADRPMVVSSGAPRVPSPGPMDK